MGIFKNTSFFTIGNILPKIASFFLLPLYSRYLTPADYGITSSMSVFSTILLVFFTFGVERSLNRLYFDQSSEVAKKNFLGTITISIVTTSLIGILLFFLFKDMVQKIFINIPVYPFYFLAIATTFLGVINIVPSMYLRITEKASIFVGLSLASFLVNMLLTIYFVVVLKAGAVGVMLAGLLSTLVILPVYLLIGYRIINFCFKPNILLSALKFSLPMIPAIMSAWVLNLSDRIFIDKFFSQAEIGLYSMGYNIAGVVLLLGTSFFTAYSPYFYRVANLESEETAKRKLGYLNNLFVMIILLIAFSIAFFSKPLIELLLDERYYPVAMYVPIIAFAYFFSLTNGAISLSMYQKKKTITIMFIILASAILNVSLNFVIIPKYGALGAASTTILAFFFQMVITYHLSKKHYFIQLRWNTIIILFLSGATVFLFFEILEFSLIISLSIKIVFVVCFTAFIYLKYWSSFREVVKGGL